MPYDLPAIIEAGSERNIEAWFPDNRSAVDKALESSGAVLLRGFDLVDDRSYMRFVAHFFDDTIEYRYRSTPRTTVGPGVYTATEYPSGLAIPPHNELSYQRSWPLNLLFFCSHPADGGGGQTPLANTESVTQRIDPRIRERFMKHNVLYVRNYREEIDLPWQTVFQTESRSELEQYCKEHAIEFEWTSANTLRTKQVCQAFAKHPRSGKLIWFNQSHLFHSSSLEPRTRQLLSEMFAEEDYPRNASYGDGSRIDDSDMKHIREAFDREAVTFQWRARDLLIIDNMLVSHGRTPYRGHRRVLTSMCNSYSPATERGEF